MKQGLGFLQLLVDYSARISSFNTAVIAHMTHCQLCQLFALQFTFQLFHDWSAANTGNST